MLGVCALWLAARAARAEDALKDPVLLQYTRGPGQCLPEEEFRREVAIAGDGVDRFDPDGPAVVRVWFEKSADGLYRGWVQYTNARGETKAPKVATHENCEVLARWIGQLAYYYQPERPPAAPEGPAPARAPAPDPAPRAAATWLPPPLPQQLFAPSRPPSSFCDRIRNLLRAMDLTIALNGLVLVTAGYTADAGPGVGIGVDVRGERFSFGMELRAVLPGKVFAREQRFPDRPTRQEQMDVSRLGALLVPCVRFEKYFAGCGVLQPGLLVLQDFVGTRFYANFSFGPRFVAEVPITERLALFGLAEALFVPLKIHKGYQDYDDKNSPAVYWTESVVSGFFGAGLSVKFE